MPQTNANVDAAQAQGDWNTFVANWDAAQARGNATSYAEALRAQSRSFRRNASSGMGNSVLSLAKAGNLQINAAGTGGRSNNQDLLAFNDGMARVSDMVGDTGYVEQLEGILQEGGSYDEVYGTLLDGAYQGLAQKLFDAGYISEDQAVDFGQDQLDALLAENTPITADEFADGDATLQAWRALVDEVGWDNAMRHPEGRKLIDNVRDYMKDNAVNGVLGYTESNVGELFSQFRNHLKTDRYEDFLRSEGIDPEVKNNIQAVINETDFDTIKEKATQISNEMELLVKDIFSIADTDPIGATQGMAFTSGTDMAAVANQLQVIESGRQNLINNGLTTIYNMVGNAVMADDTARFQADITKFNTDIAEWQNKQTMLNNIMGGLSFGLNIFGGLPLPSINLGGGGSAPTKVK